jgi:hypothetical protein
VSPQERPNLDSLRQLLRESKATSATSQQMLSDPDGAQLIVELQTVLDKAISLGRIEVAQKAADTLANVQARERDLVQAERISDLAQRQSVRVIVDELSRDSE